MLINKLVKFCDGEYRKKNCLTCTANTMCEAICGENCKECLDDIQFHRHQLRDEYNCEKLLDYYVCRYSYKYCSEIIYALNELDLVDYPYFNILSLGCGGAPDLMAFEYMNYKRDITYWGIDKSNYWGKIHCFIKTNFHNGRADFFRNVDVLEYFSNQGISNCNVLIIQYLISIFYEKIGPDGVEKWFIDLASNVVKNKPSNSPFLIVINDVDSKNTGRDTFDLFIDALQRVGLTVSKKLKRRFQDESYYYGSQKYDDNMNLFEDKISDCFAKEYCVAKYCKSVQLILEVSL